MAFLDNFINELKKLKVKTLEFYVNDHGIIEDCDPDLIKLPDPKAKYLVLNHYNQHDSNYESNIAELGENALTELLNLSDQQIKNQLSRLVSEFGYFDKIRKVYNELAVALANGRLEYFDLYHKLFPLFNVPKHDQGRVTREFMNDLEDALMFKEGALSAIIENTRKVISTRTEINEWHQSESFKYEESIRIQKFASEQEAQKLNVNVGDPVSYLPLPKTNDEAYERLRKLTGQRWFEVIKNDYLKRYPILSVDIVKEEYKILNDFITEANQLPIKQAFIKGKLLPTPEGKKLEYLRFRHNYYLDNFCEYGYGSTACMVYGEYFIFYDWLENELLKLNGVVKYEAPYDLHTHRLFSFDNAIKFHLHKDEDESFDDYRRKALSYDNYQLVNEFEKRFANSNDKEAIELLESQYYLIQAREVPPSFWLDNIEIILSGPNAFKNRAYAKRDRVKLWFAEKRKALIKSLGMDSKEIEKKTNSKRPENFEDIFVSTSWQNYIDVLTQTTPPLISTDRIFIGNRKRHIGVICSWINHLKMKGIISQTISRSDLANVLNTELKDFNMGKDGKTFDNVSNEYKKFESQLIQLTK